MLLFPARCLLFTALAALACSAASTSAAQAAVPTPPAGYANFDVRTNEGESAQRTRSAYRKALTDEQRSHASETITASEAAVRAVRGRSGWRVERLEPLGAAEIVDVGEEPAGVAAALVPGGNVPRVRAFLSERAALYGLTREQMGRLENFTDYANPAGNMVWVEFRQEANRLRVFQGEVRAGMTPNGRLFRTTGLLAPGLLENALPTQPKITPSQAAALAARTVGVTAEEAAFAPRSPAQGAKTTLAAGPFERDVETELVYFPMEPGVAALAYSVTLWEPVHVYHVLVDAISGELLWRKDLTAFQTQAATYNVYNNDDPTPFSPYTAVPDSGAQGIPIPRTNMTLIGNEAPYTFNNLGWIPDGGNTTLGNNVEAGLDLVAPDGIDPGTHAIGAGRVFSYPYVPGGHPGEQAPTLPAYRNGVLTNLFFWGNRFHDWMYRYGFTEQARNYQQDNFGRGGVGGDRVVVHAQDHSGTNNANFVAGADGTPGRLQMFIWTGPTPDRDSGLDNSVVLHELAYGPIGRLHANGSGLGTVMSGGMGEGWADFYARALLSGPEEPINGAYAVGGYATYRGANSGAYTDNYYYGVRRFPYAPLSFLGPNEKPHNPLTFADIDPAQIDLTDGAYARGPFGPATAFQSQNIGEVWASALLEMRARIISAAGYNAGNPAALQLVTDAMKLDPVNPTMLQGRDSLLAAACAGGGAHEMSVWQGFAARGMGFSARIVNAGNGTVVEAFDLPNVIPGTAIISDAAGNGNGVADPGEILQIQLPLENPYCSAPITDVQTSITGGGTANYGTINAGATSAMPMTYVVPADTPCGAILTVPVEIETSLGNLTTNVAVQIGQHVQTASESFDTVTPGAGWSQTSSGGATPWGIVNAGVASFPNAMHVGSVTTVGAAGLVSPVLPVTTIGARLSFSNKFNMESGFDGMVLEISINGGAFQDIVTAGGTFLENGYRATISASFSSPLAGRQAWTGLSGGTAAAPTYITSVVRLPDAAAGNDVQFRWVAAHDSSAAVAAPSGAWVDDIRLFGAASCTPVPGLTQADVVNALRIAGGLATASAIDVAKLNRVDTGTSANRVDFQDAASIVRFLNGE